MKQLFFIILSLCLVMPMLTAQELNADDRVNLNQVNKTYIGVYSYAYQGVKPNGFSLFQLHNYGGTPAAPAATPADAILGTFMFSGHNGDNRKQVAEVRVTATGTFSPTATPLRMDFIAGISRQKRMSILGDNGNVGIGTTTPSQKLDVDGQIRMRSGAVAGYIPVSDADGVMTWTDPSTLHQWTADGDDIYRDVGTVSIGTSSSDNTNDSPLLVANATNPEIRLGNIVGFNQAASGKLIFDEDVSSPGTCGFEIEHDGVGDKLSIISGCVLPNAGDTIIVFNRNGNVNLPVKLMIGSNDFPTEELDVDGRIKMREGAISGYVPVSDSNGRMTWTDPALLETSLPEHSHSSIVDSDGNTKIQTEETVGENIIRFDAGNVEIATMTNSRMGIRDNTPDYTFDLKHVSGTPGATNGNGLNIHNESGTHWTLYTWSSGNFSLYREGAVRGIFDGTSGAYTAASDRNLKNSIQELPSQMDKIMELRPTTYRFNGQQDDTRHYGLIAQEVREIYPELAPVIESTSEGAEKDLYGVTYSAFVPVLIKGMQEQQETIGQQQQEIEKLKTKVAEIDDLKKKLERFEQALGNCCLDTSDAAGNKEQPNTFVELFGGDRPALEQNAPNPFDSQTVIRYYLPSATYKASMTFTDMAGKVLKTVELDGEGFGTVTINANELAPGTYQYTLVVDGELVQTRQMVLTR